VLAYTRTRSLWTPILFHILNNGLGLAHDHFWDQQIHFETPVQFMLFVAILLVGIGLWLHFVLESWRTLGDPLPPDSLDAPPLTSPSTLPEPLRSGH